MKRSVRPRSLLLGLHNPRSADPKRALWIDPPGCAGHRLWRMSELPRKEWLAGFNRLNLLDAIEWDEWEAEQRRPFILERLKEAPVTVVLGHQVREFLKLPKVEWVHPQRAAEGFHWRFLPHPSGRTQMYNDPVFRAAARLLLQELATK